MTPLPLPAHSCVPRIPVHLVTCDLGTPLRIPAHSCWPAGSHCSTSPVRVQINVIRPPTMIQMLDDIRYAIGLASSILQLVSKAVSARSPGATGPGGGVLAGRQRRSEIDLIDRIGMAFQCERHLGAAADRDGSDFTRGLLPP
jgi:hypothetical protein